MSYKQDLKKKPKKKMQMTDAEIELERLKRVEAKKQLVPMRVDCRTIILVEKRKAKQSKIDEFNKKLNESRDRYR